MILHNFNSHSARCVESLFLSLLLALFCYIFFSVQCQTVVYWNSLCRKLTALMCGTHNLNINVNFSNLHDDDDSVCTFAVRMCWVWIKIVNWQLFRQQKLAEHEILMQIDEEYGSSSSSSWKIDWKRIALLACFWLRSMLTDKFNNLTNNNGESRVWVTVLAAA